MKRFFFEIHEEIKEFLFLKSIYIRDKRWSFLRRMKARDSFKQLQRIVIGTLIIVVLILGIWAGYKYPATGFSDYVSPNEEFQRGKTFWDWMQLLVIPLVLAWVAYSLANKQKEKEVEIAYIEKSENALQNYLDYMTRLMIEYKYLDKKLIESASRLMRARTLTVLEQLNGKQKGHLLRFLIETKLLDKTKTYLNMKRANLTGVELDPGGYTEFNLDGVNLDKADLEFCHFYDVQMNGISLRNANLVGVNLEAASLQSILLTQSDLYYAKLSKARMYKADLQDANLEATDLCEAILSRSNLRGANLRESKAMKTHLDSADLSFTNLSYADFEGANMTRVDFHGANLKNTNLKDTDLTDSNITISQLRKAKSIEGAKLPSSINSNKLRKKS